MIRFPNCAAGRAITSADLSAELAGSRPSRLVIRYDWSSHWGSDDFYSRYPYLTDDACRFIVDIGIRVLGGDAPSPDDPRQSGPSCDPDSPNHKLLLGAGVSLVEYLTNLAAITANEFELVALPLRVRGGDGAPARVIGIEG
jgi:kynurenine formamidase